MSTVEQFIHEGALLTLTCSKTAYTVIDEQLKSFGISHRLSLTVHSSIIARSIRIARSRKALYARSQSPVVGEL